MTDRKDRIAMRGFVLRQWRGETLAFGFILLLAGLGIAGSLLGAMGAADTKGFWQNFVGGVAVVGLMSIPLWFAQRWLAAGRRMPSAEHVRKLRRTNFVLLALWVIVVGIAAVGFAMNLRANAPLESSAALIVFIAFITVWAFLVLRILWRLPSEPGVPREQ